MRIGSCVTKLLLLATALCPSVLLSQTVTTVRVPVSATQSYVADACKATAKPFNPGADSSARDTLHVQIKNDRDEPDTVHVPLVVQVTGKSEKLDRGTKELVMVSPIGAFRGAAVIVTRGENILVCAKSPQEDEAETRAQNAFRVGIGASFSFQSGNSKSHLYSDVNAFVPKVGGSPFGVEAGIYTGSRSPRQAAEGEVSPDARAGARRVTLFRDRPGADSVYRIELRGPLTSVTTESTTGFYFGPTLEIRPNLHLVLHLDQTKRDFTETVTSKVLRTDTTIVARNDSIRFASGSALPGDTTTKRSFSQFETMVGFGLLLDVRLGSIGLRLKPVAGLARQGSGARFAYAAHFKLTEFTKGLRIGGDVKTFSGSQSPSLLVYLAKDSGLEKLASFLLGGDNDK